MWSSHSTPQRNTLLNVLKSSLLTFTARLSLQQNIHNLSNQEDSNIQHQIRFDNYAVNREKRLKKFDYKQQRTKILSIIVFLFV